MYFPIKILNIMAFLILTYPLLQTLVYKIRHSKEKLTRVRRIIILQDVLILLFLVWLIASDETSDIYQIQWSLFCGIIAFYMGTIAIYERSLHRVTIHIYERATLYILLGMVLYLLYQTIYMENFFILLVLRPLTIVFFTYWIQRLFRNIKYIAEDDERRSWKRMNIHLLLVFVILFISTVLLIPFHELTPNGLGFYDQLGLLPDGFGIYNMFGLGAIIIHILFISILFYFFLKTHQKIKKNNYTDISFLTIDKLFLTACITALISLGIQFLRTFFAEPPIIPLMLLRVSMISVGLLNAIYSFMFMIRVYTIHPNERIFNFLGGLSGFLFGMLIPGILSLNDITELELLTGVLVIMVSISNIYYAFKSAKRQEKPLIMSSMRYYGYASLSFLLIMFVGLNLGITGLSTEGNMLVDTLLRLGQVFHMIFSYTAFWKPYWFRNKYELLNSRANYIYRVGKPIKN